MHVKILMVFLKICCIKVNFVCFYPFCLTELHVNIHHHKHMVVIYKDKQLIKDNLSFITSTNQG